MASPFPSRPEVYRVYGMSQSYFTRKMAAYLDYKRIPWLLRRSANMAPRIVEAGFPGGMPAVETPDGIFMWDSTSMILHLEGRFPDPAVLPPDSVQRFLTFLLDDVGDEWLYRCAVGSRWMIPENNAVGGWELARDMTVEVPLACDQAFAGVRAHVSSSCERFGVTAQNVGLWMDEALRPWLRALGAHLARRPYLFGGRPSLADFTLFGGAAAHFANDPGVRRWTDEDAPAYVAHAHRLLEPEDQTFGEWSAPDDVPDTLIVLLADLGRLYLPWVARATVDGEAPVPFAGGPAPAVRASEFLKEARATLLARYAADRSPALDAVLERAGILRWFRDHLAQAGRIPDVAAPPRPALNRPFPPAGV